jgi:kynurenine formamidase
MADQPRLSDVLGRARVYDLSQPVFAGCPGWPTYPPTVLESSRTIASDGFNAERLDLITHTGTHLDVPYHFFDDGKRLHEVPVGEFQGPAAVLDLRPLEPAQGIGPSDLERAAEWLRPGDIAILCTGWGEKRSLEPIFMYEWPYLTGEGASWLVERGVRAVAIDALSIGGWADGTGRPCHEVLLGSGRWILEDIRCPAEVVEARRCHLFAFPILIQGCGGSLVRAVAAVD